MALQQVWVAGLAHEADQVGARFVDAARDLGTDPHPDLGVGRLLRLRHQLVQALDTELGLDHRVCQPETSVSRYAGPSLVNASGARVGNSPCGFVDRLVIASPIGMVARTAPSPAGEAIRWQ